MKILLMNLFHYRKGGSEAVYFNTAELLREHGHEVCFFSRADEKDLPDPNADLFVDERRYSAVQRILYYFYNFQAARNLERLIERERPDLAHVHLLWGGFSPSVLRVLRKHGIPVIHTAHDYRLCCPAYTFRNGRGDAACERCGGGNYLHCMANRCCKGSFAKSAMMAMEMFFRNIFFPPAKYLSGLIFVSAFSRDKHRQYLRGFSPETAVVLHNFSDSAARDPEAAGKPERPCFLFFGRLSAEKGLTTLVSAFEQLPGFELKIVGSGPMAEELAEQIRGRRLRNVEMTGHLEGDALRRAVSGAYFVVVPSECYENNPMTIVEAYSHGVPVIGAALGGIPEIVDDRKTGILFTPGDPAALARAMTEAAGLSAVEYAGYRENAGRFFDENFSKERYYSRLMAFYDKIIAAGNPAGR